MTTICMFHLTINVLIYKMFGIKVIQLDLFDSCSLEGVPLAYENIRIVGQHGGIYDDSGYIHMDIQANFILFQPQKGQKLLVRFTFTALCM